MSAPAALGRYPVRRRLGAGAFATVWLAHDEHLDSAVAIKVLADNWAGDAHVRRRFVEEGRFLRRVESPHVVPVYDAGELDDGRPYLVMAYADHGTLVDRLAAGRLSRVEACDVVVQVARGLTALHAHDVLHRDVKPGNVLFRSVVRDGRPTVEAMVGDLGLGKTMDMSSRLTMIGGTPAYVAPEQARGEGLDGRADQYSLAALAHLLLTGRPPHDHLSLVAAGEATGPAPLSGEVPPAVEDVLKRGLAPDREDRFADVAAFADALVTATGVEPAAEDGGPVARPGAASRGDGVQPTATSPTDATRLEAAPGPAPHADHGGGRGSDHPGRRVAWLVPAAVVLAVGALAGWALQPAMADDRTLDDVSGTISVSVPEPWTASVRREAWTPEGATTDYPGLAAGTSAAWQGEDAPAPGVFAGLMAGERLPTKVPQHPECADAGRPVRDEEDGDESLTVVFRDCGDVAVTVERVVQATSDTLLWVQVRSDDRATANRVLDSVELHGI